MRLSLCLFPLLAACQSAATETPVSEPLPLERFIKIYDQNAAGRIGLEAMLDAAAKFEVVFFGETHLDETTHRLELAVYKGLIERTGGKVVLAMEMFDRGQQAELDAYLAGELAESEFIEKVRPWGNYRTGYRLLIETAKQRGLPVIGSNPPRGLLRKVGMKGPQALETLEPEERALLPEELHPNTDSYWDRFARRVRGHAGMVERMTPDQLLTSVQSYWDNSMGESCVRALKRHPDHLVLHINGGFHSQNREGAVTQLLARRPETRVAVIEALAVTDLAGFEDPRQPERADFLVAAESRARGLSEGYHAVTMAPELRYRLHMPEIATDKTPVPLLILLPDDGFRSRDGLATWWPALGKEAAVAVVEPPHLTLEDDLYTGGRWFFPDSFREDLGPLEGGLARIVDYIRRHYPVLEDRVVLAGEGSGSTIVAATALYASGLNVKTIAIAPRRYTGLRMLALPEKGPDRELKVLVPEADREWWETEAADYAKAGVQTELVAVPDDGWSRFTAAEDAIREALRLDPRPQPDAGTQTLLVLGLDTPRARHWAHRIARRLDRAAVVSGEDLSSFLEKNAGPWEVRPLACDGEAVDLGPLPQGAKALAPVGPADLMEGKGIPLAAGPFGGTTVIVLPDEWDEEMHEAWEVLEEKKVLHKRSRFAALKVAPAKELGTALQEIKDSGRSNVLVVPALFCADGASMRKWREGVKKYEDLLSLSWSPGLGGSLGSVLAPSDR